MTEGVREGFAAVRALELPVTPFPLRVLFAWLPLRFAIRYWRRFFATKVADVVFGQHARIAAHEMRDVASDCRMLLEQSGAEASALPSFTALSTPMPRGSGRLRFRNAGRRRCSKRP
jgi:hypothetical protein